METFRTFAAKKMEDAINYFLAAVCVLVASLAAALAVVWLRRHK